MRTHAHAAAHRGGGRQRLWRLLLRVLLVFVLLVGRLLLVELLLLLVLVVMKLLLLLLLLLWLLVWLLLVWLLVVLVLRVRRGRRQGVVRVCDHGLLQRRGRAVCGPLARRRPAPRHAHAHRHAAPATRPRPAAAARARRDGEFRWRRHGRGCRWDVCVRVGHGRGVRDVGVRGAAAHDGRGAHAAG